MSSNFTSILLYGVYLAVFNNLIFLLLNIGNSAKDF
nr:MAG TPA: hypothetical protein [Caudoviricetes sp.]DAH40548.1 MAG TPA: hypothetical protein [Caudoviricetes sp.]